MSALRAHVAGLGPHVVAPARAAAAATAPVLSGGRMVADAALTPRPDPPRCPYCGEDRLVERDPVGGLYVCVVCAKTWKR
jgi:hypothetical protein